MRQTRTNRPNIAASIFIMAAGAATARGGMIVASAPDRYQTTFMISGAEGVGRSPNKWEVSADGSAMVTEKSGRKIDYFVSLGDLATDSIIGVTAKNFSDLGLPDDFHSFKVDVSVNDHLIDTLLIGASDDNWNTGWVPVSELVGDVKVTLKWRNDEQRKNQFDTNIGFGALSFASAAAASSVPPPASAALFFIACGFAGSRRRG